MPDKVELKTGSLVVVVDEGDQASLATDFVVSRVGVPTVIAQVGRVTLREQTFLLDPRPDKKS